MPKYVHIYCIHEVYQQDVHNVCRQWNHTSIEIGYTFINIYIAARALIASFPRFICLS